MEEQSDPVAILEDILDYLGKTKAPPRARLIVLKILKGFELEISAGIIHKEHLKPVEISTPEQKNQIFVEGGLRRVETDQHLNVGYRLCKGFFHLSGWPHDI